MDEIRMSIDVIEDEHRMGPGRLVGKLMVYGERRRIGRRSLRSARSSGRNRELCLIGSTRGKIPYSASPRSWWVTKCALMSK